MIVNAPIVDADKVARIGRERQAVGTADLKRSAAFILEYNRRKKRLDDGNLAWGPSVLLKTIPAKFQREDHETI